MSSSSAQSLTVLQEAEALKQQGNECFRGKDLCKAKQFYLEAANKLDHSEPKHHHLLCLLWSNIAQIGLETKNWEDSLAASTKALDFDPRHPKSLLRRSVALKEVHRITDALKDLKLCLSVDPGNMEAKRLFREYHESNVQAKQESACNDLLCTNLDICIKCSANNDDIRIESDVKQSQVFMDALKKVRDWGCDPQTSLAIVRNTQFMSAMASFLSRRISETFISDSENSLPAIRPLTVLSLDGSKDPLEPFPFGTLNKLRIQVGILRVFNAICWHHDGSTRQGYRRGGNEPWSLGDRGEAAHPPLAFKSSLVPSSHVNQARDAINTKVDWGHLTDTFNYCLKVCQNSTSSACSSLATSPDARVTAAAICGDFCLEFLALLEVSHDLNDRRVFEVVTRVLDTAKDQTLIVQALQGLASMGHRRLLLGSRVPALRKSQAIRQCISSIIASLEPDSDTLKQQCLTLALVTVLRLLADKDRPANECVNILEDLEPILQSSLRSSNTKLDTDDANVGLRLLDCIYTADRSVFCTALSSKNILQTLYEYSVECGRESSPKMQDLAVNLFARAMEFPELRDLLLVEESSKSDCLRFQKVEDLVNVCVTLKAGSKSTSQRSLAIALVICKLIMHDKALYEYIMVEKGFLNVSMTSLESAPIHDAVMAVQSGADGTQGQKALTQDVISASGDRKCSQDFTPKESNPNLSLIQSYLEVLFFLSFHGRFKQALLKQSKTYSIGTSSALCSSETLHPVFANMKLIGELIIEKKVPSQFALYHCGILSNLLRSRCDGDRISHSDQKSSVGELDAEQMEALREFWDKMPDASKPRRAAIYDRGDPSLTEKYRNILLDSNLFATTVKLCQKVNASPEILGQGIDVLASVIKDATYRPRCVKAGGLQALLRAADFFTSNSKQKSAIPASLNNHMDEDLLRCRQSLAQLCISINPQLFSYKEIMDLTSHCLHLLKSSHELYQYEAALALTNLMAVSESSRQRVLHGQGAAALMDLVFSENHLLRAAGLEGICNLSLCEDFLTQIAQGHHRNNLQIVLAFLGDWDNPRAQIAASACLALITTDVEVVAKLLTIPNVSNLLKVVNNVDNFYSKPDLQLRVLTVFQNILTLWPQATLAKSENAPFLISKEDILDCFQKIPPNKMIDPQVFDLFSAMAKEFVPGLKTDLAKP